MIIIITEDAPLNKRERGWDFYQKNFTDSRDVKATAPFDYYKGEGKSVHRKKYVAYLIKKFTGK